jgi:hypothetical protein
MEGEDRLRGDRRPAAPRLLRGTIQRVARDDSAIPSGSSMDAVIEVYMRSVDRSLIRENLRKTPDERVRALQELQRFAEELQQAGRVLKR